MPPNLHDDVLDELNAGGRACKSGTLLLPPLFTAMFLLPICVSLKSSKLG